MYVTALLFTMRPITFICLKMYINYVSFQTQSLSWHIDAIIYFLQEQEDTSYCYTVHTSHTLPTLFFAIFSPFTTLMFHISRCQLLFCSATKSNECLCMRVTSCGYLAMKWKHNYTREVLLSLHFLSSSLSCAPLLSGGRVLTRMHSGAASICLCLSVFHLSDTHTHRLPKLFVTIIIGAGLMTVQGIERKNLSVWWAWVLEKGQTDWWF